MKQNEELQKDVQNAIKWEPLLSAAEIGVTVNDGIVTLTGTVDSYSKKKEAEDAAKSVAGVTAVVEKIEIAFPNGYTKTDAEIAKLVVNALKWNLEVPSEKIKVVVQNGWVTMEGELEWNYQKDEAKSSVNYLNGVKGVSNLITIRSETNDRIEKDNIVSAFSRNWSVDDQDIRISVIGNKVTLNGVVDSLYQKDEAARIAWSAPGVWSVDNELVVEYD